MRIVVVLLSNRVVGMRKKPKKKVSSSNEVGFSFTLLLVALML